MATTTRIIETYRLAVDSKHAAAAMAVLRRADEDAHMEDMGDHVMFTITTFESNAPKLNRIFWNRFASFRRVLLPKGDFAAAEAIAELSSLDHISVGDVFKTAFGRKAVRLSGPKYLLDKVKVPRK